MTGASVAALLACAVGLALSPLPPPTLGRSLLLFLGAAAIAALIALPLAMFIGHRRRYEFVVVSLANLGRAIPAFGLLVFFVILQRRIVAGLTAGALK